MAQPTVVLHREKPSKLIGTPIPEEETRAEARKLGGGAEEGAIQDALRGKTLRPHPNKPHHYVAVYPRSNGSTVLVCTKCGTTDLRGAKNRVVGSAAS
jgi:hypothetical protein